MPVDSKFTDSILDFMKREKRPVTASEIQQAVGMSRQAAYGWLESNSWRVREVGKGRHNAAAFVLSDADVGNIETPSNFRPKTARRGGIKSQRSAPAVTSLLSGEARDLRVGSELRVADIRLEGGSVVVVLEAADGTELSVTLG